MRPDCWGPSPPIGAAPAATPTAWTCRPAPRRCGSISRNGSPAPWRCARCWCGWRTRRGPKASQGRANKGARRHRLFAPPLADYGIVYFATHGLVAGDVKGLAELSLVLSIPKQPTEFDDGLLTASEVAQLKLNADWVVLSACNTIAGDKPGAEALSGLARSFFYAGARALLVSHWAV